MIESKQPQQQVNEPVACFKCGHAKHDGECVNVAPQLQQISEDFLRSVINLCGRHGASPFAIEGFDPEDKWIADLWRKAEAMLEAAPKVKP